MIYVRLNKYDLEEHMNIGLCEVIKLETYDKDEIRKHAKRIFKYATSWIDDEHIKISNSKYVVKACILPDFTEEKYNKWSYCFISNAKSFKKKKGNKKS